MTQRENRLRTIRFEHPEYIPVSFWPCEAVFTSYDPHAVEELLEVKGIGESKFAGMKGWIILKEEAKR